MAISKRTNKLGDLLKDIDTSDVPIKFVKRVVVQTASGQRFSMYSDMVHMYSNIDELINDSKYQYGEPIQNAMVEIDQELLCDTIQQKVDAYLK